MLICPSSIQKNEVFCFKHLQHIYHLQKDDLFISSLRQKIKKKGVLEKQHPLRSLPPHNFSSLWENYLCSTSFIPTYILLDQQLVIKQIKPYKSFLLPFISWQGKKLLKPTGPDILFKPSSILIVSF